MANTTQTKIFGSDTNAAAKPVECLGITFPNDEARRQYFLQKLSEKLKDPAFRSTEGFPIGDDELRRRCPIRTSDIRHVRAVGRPADRHCHAV